MTGRHKEKLQEGQSNSQPSIERPETSKGRKAGAEGGVKKSRAKKGGEKENRTRTEGGRAKKRKGVRRKGEATVEQEQAAGSVEGALDSEEDLPCDESLSHRRRVKRRPLQVING
jgi:hypothetical protein